MAEREGHIRIFNSMWETWCKVRLNPVAESCLKVVVRMTVGFNRQRWPITIETFMEMTGTTDPDQIYRALKILEKSGMIEVYRQKGKPNEYSFVEDPGLWTTGKIAGTKKELPAKLTTGKIDGSEPAELPLVSDKIAGSTTGRIDGSPVHGTHVLNSVHEFNNHGESQLYNHVPHDVQQSASLLADHTISRIREKLGREPVNFDHQEAFESFHTWLSQGLTPDDLQGAIDHCFDTLGSRKFVFRWFSEDLDTHIASAADTKEGKHDGSTRTGRSACVSDAERERTSAYAARYAAKKQKDQTR